MTRLPLPASLLAFACCLVTVAASAQQLATLSSLVTDAAGSVIAGAEIKLANSLTAATHTATTNENGFYTIPFLKPGGYELNIAAPGFNASVGTVIRNESIVNLPLINRRAAQLARLSGFVVQNATGSNFALAGGPLRKDKTHFFFSYEGTRIKREQTRVLSVPSRAEIAGNFSATTILESRYSWDRRKFEALSDKRGLSGNHIAHRFINSAVWDLPVGKGRRLNIENRVLNQLFGDWKVGTIVEARTGSPFSVQENNAALVYPTAASVRSNLIVPYRLNPNWRNNVLVEPYFDTSVFAAPPYGQSAVLAAIPLWGRASSRRIFPC
jgi:hypothetical protein